MAIRLDAMLEAVELPAGIANLAAGLADVDRNALTLQVRRAGLSVAANMKGKIKRRRRRFVCLTLLVNLRVGLTSYS